MVDVAYAAMPNGNRLNVDGNIYCMRETGTRRGIFDERGTLVLQTGAPWRDSERELGIVCCLWPESLPEGPLGTLVLVCGSFLQSLTSGHIDLT